MGSYRFNGFGSRAGNFVTEEGLVLSDERQSRNNVADSSSSPALFPIAFCAICICSCAQAIALSPAPETGKRKV